MRGMHWLLTILGVGIFFSLPGKETRVTLEDLIPKVASQEKMTKKQVKKCLKAFFEVLKEELRQGKSVQIRGFGTFYPSLQKERKWKNPKTGEVKTLPATKTVRFRPSQRLKAYVNQK